MNQRTIVLIVIVFVLIVAGMFGYAYLERQKATTEPEPTPQEPGDDEGPYAGIERVSAKHWFEDGTHTLAGEIPMPTPCDLLEWDTSVAESFPEQVTVNFTVINTADVCAQVITPQRFLVSFDASEEAEISTTLEGRQLELNLVPPAEGETPEDFELFIKG